MINHTPAETQLSKTANDTCVCVQTSQFVGRLYCYSDLPRVGVGGLIQHTLEIVYSMLQ